MGTKPLVKWAGGKRSLLQHIEPLLPRDHGRYFEPFVGGGALFFHLLPEDAILGDTNRDLIECYQAVRDMPHEVLSELRRLRNSKQDYYMIRASVPNSAPQRAARFIYLTTLSFNGIYRVNRSGEFNVPYGGKEHLDPYDEGHLLGVSEALKHASIVAQDFALTVSEARRGDLIYFDPPYTVAHSNNGFIKYNAHLFSWSDQIRLAAAAHDLAERGCHVFVSNADHFSIDALYSRFCRLRMSRASVIAAGRQHRGSVTESLFYTTH